MKSKQLNYFASNEEIEHFDEFLSKIGAKIIGLPLIDKNICYSSSIKEHYYGNYPWPLHFNVINVKMVNDLILNYVEKQKYYLVDSLRSPVIEMSKCHFNENKRTISRARIYYTLGYFDEYNVWQNKRNDFVIWADDILKEFKKLFVKKINGSYLSPNVSEIITSSNWRLIN